LPSAVASGSLFLFFFSSRRRHTRWPRDWSSDVCSSDLFDLTRFRKFDLILWITDVIDDHQVGERTDFAGFRVDIDAQVARRADALFRGREQGVRDRLEQDFAFDPALPL